MFERTQLVISRALEFRAFGYIHGATIDYLRFTLNFAYYNQLKKDAKILWKLSKDIELQLKILRETKSTDYFYNNYYNSIENDIAEYTNLYLQPDKKHLTSIELKQVLLYRLSTEYNESHWKNTTMLWETTKGIELELLRLQDTNSTDHFYNKYYPLITEKFEKYKASYLNQNKEPLTASELEKKLHFTAKYYYRVSSRRYTIYGFASAILTILILPIRIPLTLITDMIDMPINLVFTKNKEKIRNFIWPIVNILLLPANITIALANDIVTMSIDFAMLAASQATEFYESYRSPYVIEEQENTEIVQQDDQQVVPDNHNDVSTSCTTAVINQFKMFTDTCVKYIWPSTNTSTSPDNRQDNRPSP